MTNPLDVLVVATHPDDAEISVGGTILVARSKGLRVGVVELTDGEPTPHGTPEIRRRETEAATRVLDLSWRHNLGLPNRSLQPTLEARRTLAAVFRTVRPRVILAPYWEDVHPDHVAASRLVDDARFWSKLSRTDIPGNPFLPQRVYYYWSLHLRIHPKPAFVVDITEAIKQKMEAVRAYDSQLLTGHDTRHPTILDDIRDRSRYWGWTIGTGYGEPLASREEIGIAGVDALL